MVVILWEAEIVTIFVKTFKLWSVDCAGEKIKKDIRRDCLKASLYCIFQVLIATVVATLYSISDGIEKEIYLIYYIIEWCFPHHYSLMTLIIKIGCFPTIYAMTVHAFQLLYFSKHIQFQMKMLNEHVRNISEPDADDVCDGNDEKMISHRLKFCSLRYIEIKEAVNLVNGFIGIPLLTFPITGGLLGTSIGVYFFENTVKASYNMYIFIMFGFVMFVAVFVGIIGAGQNIEDQPEEMLEALLENEWYNWSHKNKMELLLFLSQVMQPLRVEYSACFALNYKLGLKIIRGIYSTVSVLLHLKR